jgi:hypothetical protein
VATCSTQFDETLKRMKQNAEERLAALKSRHFAVFEVLPSGEDIDPATEQIATLEQTIQELDEAIEIARKATQGLSRGQFPRLVK